MSDLKIRPIIGLEVHVQLATRTKLFCPCELEFAAEPNSRTCPVCLGLPGALPVMNRQAFEYAVLGGLALGCDIAPLTKWDRKSYYYPDMPKNYQTSQYDLPVAFDGSFEILASDGTTKKIGIIRAHLEEDAGKNMHEGLDHTRVDLNRAGTPLLEIVTQPDIDNADDAYTFCVELQRLVRFLGISDADMQKGQMRFEPNVNVSITTPDGTEYRTPISEVKNLNSFRSVRGAIEYEIQRQVHAWEDDHGYTLANKGKQNYGWNDAREVTEFQRGKEESHDYRYFPEPDLVPAMLDDSAIESFRARVGELPLARERRYIECYGMTQKDCEIILADLPTAELYEAAANSGADPKTLTKQFVGVWNQLASTHNTTISRLGINSEVVADLAKLVDAGTISASAASQIAEHIYKTGIAQTAGVADIAAKLGLIQERDEGRLEAWIDEVFAANAQAIEDALQNPKKAKAAAGFLRGQLMKVSQGKADPKLAGDLIEKKLNALKDGAD
ncbi:MAG: Asp-tRNA(Asn)/Glu-tRNA(Gln) amidotransferase subunit GatB [Phycisphaerales bacterium]|nr:Asp-tRNA(Asn)/Glu-tRNA(Gln) amidotransferase subunit GatB [Phycisphaerales bacterium]MCB9864163.1 Asp-tRNA(Asn)/Glu-tRNA(Gln) amidotransferase subunit GatB [Phycisphaerales bacterium]